MSFFLACFSHLYKGHHWHRLVFGLLRCLAIQVKQGRMGQGQQPLRATAMATVTGAAEECHWNHASGMDDLMNWEMKLMPRKKIKDIKTNDFLRGESSWVFRGLSVSMSLEGGISGMKPRSYWTNRRLGCWVESCWKNHHSYLTIHQRYYIIELNYLWKETLPFFWIPLVLVHFHEHEWLMI